MFFRRRPALGRRHRTRTSDPLFYTQKVQTGAFCLPDRVWKTQAAGRKRLLRRSLFQPFESAFSWLEGKIRARDARVT